MPLEKMVVESDRAWAIWKIKESEEDLHSRLKLAESPSPRTTHPQKRLEFLAGRVLIEAVLEQLDLPYHGLTKDEFGKPFLKGHSVHLSLSHSFPFVAVIIESRMSVGIDLEQPKDKLLRVAPRVLATEEQLDAGNDIVKHCVYWCAKEAMIKFHGKKDLTLATQLLISPFELSHEGHIIGRLIVDGTVTMLTLYYLATPQFVLVFNTN